MVWVSGPHVCSSAGTQHGQAKGGTAGVAHAAAPWKASYLRCAGPGRSSELADGKSNQSFDESSALINYLIGVKVDT